MALTARIRFGDRANGAVPRYDLGETVEVWCDFRDEDGALVDASGVLVAVWYPGGAEVSPALTPVEETAGTWRVDIPAELYAGLWRVRFTSAAPSVASDSAWFSVRSATPPEAVPPGLDYPSLEELLATAYEAGSANRLRKRLDELVVDDPTCVADMAPGINAALLSCRIAGIGLDIPTGVRRLNSQINLATGDDVYCYQGSELVAYFNSSGRNGIVGMAEAAWAATPASPQRNIRWEGGIIRRNGTLSGDGLTWTGNTGNVFSLWAEDLDISRVWVKGYSVGRAFLLGGRNVKIDNILCMNPENYLGLACPAIGGTGFCRWYSGGPFTATRLFSITGDDGCQAVPAATDSIGVDVTDVTYDQFYCMAYKGRAFLCALTVPDRLDSDLQNSQTVGVRNVTFSRGRGGGKTAWAIYNTDSTGVMGKVLIDDCLLSVLTDLEGGTWNYAVEIIGSDGTAGAGPVIVRESGLLNVINGGIRARGTQVRRIEFHNWTQPAPSNAASASYPVHVQDADAFIMIGGCIAGAAGSDKSLVVLGRDDENQSIDLARFERMAFTGVPSLRYAIQGGVYGAVRLEVEGCSATPLDGVTDARAIDFPDNCTQALVADNTWPTLGSVLYVNVPATAEFRGNVISDAAAATNGMVEQVVTAASTLAWNGRAQVMRISSSAAQTIDTISLPSGYAPRDTPILALYGINNFAMTLSSAGNIAPAGSTSFSAGQTIVLLYSFALSKWLQIGAHAPITQAANTQSISAGAVTWTQGRELIRISASGTLTSISGTPTYAAELTLRAVQTSGSVTVQHGASTMRLKGSAHVALAQNDTLTLQYDTANGYWFETARSVA